MAQCGRNKRNECRNLHSLIHREGRTLPIPVDSVQTPVLVLSGKCRIETVSYPVLMLSRWVDYILSQDGQILLGGHRLSDGVEPIKRMFDRFWSRFQHIRSDLSFPQGCDSGNSINIPYGLHGDEGRGKLRRPIMCLSYQPLISHRGMGCLNSSGRRGLYSYFKNPYKAQPSKPVGNCKPETQA